MQQETTLVPHRTPNLSVLLERAKTGESAADVAAFLTAGGSAQTLVETAELPMPLLHYMALYNQHSHRELAESMRLLLDAGAEINLVAHISAGDNRTALMCAAERDCCTAVSAMLLQAGADACARPWQKGLTALHLAAQLGLPECCELLLKHADTLLEVKDTNGQTALSHAAQSGSVDKVQLLLQYGADVVLCLIKAGADVNATDCDGFCALTTAVQSNDIALVRLLVKHGGDLNRLDHDGQNVLFKAAYLGHAHMMQLLVQCGGLSVTAVGNDGTTVLMTALIGGHRLAIEWLLKQQDIAINTLYTFASGSSSCGGAEIQLLLANGADIHKCTKKQQTALDIAASYGNLECANALIAAGADVNHADSEGHATLHTALCRKHVEIVQLLLEHGATAVMNRIVSATCANGPYCCTSATALMLSTETNAVKVLLDAGADVHVVNGAGNTSLHLAAKHKLPVPVVCLLIKAGAKLNAVNSCGKTPAQVARDTGNILVEQLLIRARQQGH
eukprot:4987-Heterococcus_DN1.PRE.1